jgi:pantoate--beta-alanine ligase
MARSPRVVRAVPALRRSVAQFRNAGEKIALVATMGALHEGHLRLVQLARKRARRVIVSIFVNPAQFAPHEDFASYPRSMTHDLTLLTGVDLVWAPAMETMYPPGFATQIVPQGPAKVGLEDAFRPHFFAGVATVVAKLLIQSAPDIAVFGEKDFQQLKVVTRLAQDLDLPVKIIGAPIVREKDGLAMSSRNTYLSSAERAAAPALYRVLIHCADRISNGDRIARVLDEGSRAIEELGFAIDYLEARKAETLEKVESIKDGPLRLLAAAKLGCTRLIDNVAVPPR